jgi:hypothetical protein
MFRYVGDSLASLVTEASFAATDRSCRSIAQDAQEVMFHTSVAATPATDHEFVSVFAY